MGSGSIHSCCRGILPPVLEMMPDWAMNEGLACYFVALTKNCLKTSWKVWIKHSDFSILAVHEIFQ